MPNMKRLAILILIIFFQSYAANASSDTPNKVPSVREQNNYYKTDNNKKNGNYTHNIPNERKVTTNINAIPHQIKNTDVIEIPQSNKNKSEDVWDILNRLSTIVIALFAVIQSFALIFQYSAMRKQVKELKASVEVARQTAQAAELNARAVIRMELPIIRIFPDHLTRTDRLQGENESFIGGAADGCRPTKFSALRICDFRNDGRTPAFPITLSLGWKITDVLPNIPIYTKSFKFKHSSVMNPNDDFVPSDYPSFVLS